METPFLSIITVNLNNCEGLKKTMQMVFAQTFQDFEYLVIDGKSTDGSLELIQENSSKLDHWVSETDTGIYNAMNKGIEISTGKYLLFLNSGDAFTSGTALGDFIHHQEFEGDIIYGDYKFEKGYKKYPDELYPSYFIRTSLPHQCTFFRRNVFSEMGHYDEKYRIGADRAFYIKCYLSNKYLFKHVPYFLTEFDLSGVSNDEEFKKKKKEDELLLKEQYGDDYDKYKKELEALLSKNAVKRNSIKGIIKRIKKRLSL